MNFNILDIIIIFILLSGIIIGMKRGVIKQGVMTIGMLIVIILSFILKNPLSEIMYRSLPFYNFDGLFGGLSVVNILVYEIIAFLIVFSILSVLFSILVKVSSIVETLLKMTVILAIPSKILGAILGFIEYYLLAFIILFILSSPAFKFNGMNFISESKLNNIIISNTPFMSSLVDDTIDTFKEIDSLIQNRGNMSKEQFDCEALNIMVDNKLLDIESADYLYSEGKIDQGCKLE